MNDYNARFRLDGKIALVTGAARGLGAAMARTLVAGGARVMLSDILDKEGRGVAAELGANAAFVHHDVTREDEWEKAVAATVERFGGLDVLVNNAGTETAALFADCELEEFQRVMSINADGTFLGIKHGIRAMRPTGACGRGGSIVNLSSAAGLVGIMSIGAYCGAKGAVRLMTKSAAAECGRFGYGIRVNSVHPGLVKTEMGEKFLQNFVRLGLVPDYAAIDEAFLAAHPIGLGQPDDIANAVCFLASDASRWMTGAELAVDGGLTAV